MHQRLRITRNAHGGRGAGLDAHDQRFIGQESPHPPPESGDTRPQGRGDKSGHPLIQPGRHNARYIRGPGQRTARTSRHEIGDTLGRSDLMLAAVLPGQPLELLLEFQPGQLAPLCPQKSASRTSVTKPELAKTEFRPLGDIPFTTDSAASVIAGTMNPPGHIQNE